MAKETKGRGRKPKEVVKREPKVEVVEVDETQIEEAVVWINNKIRNNVHGTYLEIGDYIFENFFGGDLEQVKSFNPHKTSSFRKLIERDDLMISKTNLFNAVHVAVQEKLLLPTVQLTEQLSFTHKVALLPLKNFAMKAKLANKAIEKHLTVEELKEQVKKAKENEPRSAAGRPALPGFLKSVTKSYSVFNRDGSLNGLDEETISGLDKDELTELDKKLKLLVSSINQIMDAVSKALANPTPPTPAEPE